jgi:hypothetical protein
MDTRTGELLSALKFEELKERDVGKAKFFDPVPDKLEEEAKKELAGRDRAVVDLKKRTPLTKWAQEQTARRKRVNKRRVKSKMAKASRKRNRG